MISLLNIILPTLWSQKTVFRNCPSWSKWGIYYIHNESEESVDYLYCICTISNVTFVIPGNFPTKIFTTRHFRTRHFPNSDISLQRLFPNKTFSYQHISLPGHFPTKIFPYQDISLPRYFSTRTFPYQDISLLQMFPYKDVALLHMPG